MSKPPEPVQPSAWSIAPTLSLPDEALRFFPEGWSEIDHDADPDAWVRAYEARLEAEHRKQRTEGALQTGVFHTPQAVAAYLARRTLGGHLAARRRWIRALLAQGRKREARIVFRQTLELRVMDPACGTGVFPVEALRCLHAFYQETREEGPDFTLSEPAAYALRHQIFGVDIDPAGVAVSRTRLMQWAARLDGCESDRQLALFPEDGALLLGCGDTLTSFPPEVRWDFILGNPPYVTEVRGQAKRFQPLREQGDFYRAKMDLCDAFLAWAVEHLTPDGQLAYVLPEYWTQRTHTEPLRARLWREGRIREFWALKDLSLFPNAPGHHTSFLLWRKRPPASREHREYGEPRLRTTRRGVTPSHNLPDHWRDARTESAALLLDPASGKLVCGDFPEIALVAKLAACPPLLRKDDIQQGVILPQGRLRPEEERGKAGKKSPDTAEVGVFLLTEAEVAAMAWTTAERAMLKPYYPPTGFRAFQGFAEADPPYRLIYTDQARKAAIENNPHEYPNLVQHLARFTGRLTSAYAPYGLHRARQPEWFESGARIFCPRQVLMPACAVIRHSAYVGEGFYIIRPASHTIEDVDWYCALMNSLPGWYWFYHQKRKGDRLQIDKDVLSVFPAPLGLTAQLRQDIGVVARRLSDDAGTTEARAALIARLDMLACQAYQLTEAEIRMMIRKRERILRG